MKNYPLILIMLLGVSEKEHNNIHLKEIVKLEKIKTISAIKIKPKNIPIKIKKDYLIDAIINVESRGDSLAYAKGENAVGILQIRPIMVNEVNRLLRKQKIKKRYCNKDRWSKTKSIEMFNIVKDYYYKDSSNEVIARCWNGGRKGYERKSTINYWEKVKIELGYLKEID